jgi:hypothetical protein
LGSGAVAVTFSVFNDLDDIKSASQTDRECIWWVKQAGDLTIGIDGRLMQR